MNEEGFEHLDQLPLRVSQIRLLLLPSISLGETTEQDSLCFDYERIKGSFVVLLAILIFLSICHCVDAEGQAYERQRR